MFPLVFTNSEYHDVCDVFSAQAHKFDFEFTVGSNKPYPFQKTLLYDNSLSYSEKLVQLLEQIEDSHILFLHEDHVLLEKPNLDNFNLYDLDFIRLQKTGNPFTVLKFPQERPNIHWIASPDSDSWFAVQPTIWRREKFIEYLKWMGPRTIYELELSKGHPTIQGGIYYHWSDRRVGGHFQSSLFPCILTAINKGRWNLSEYSELEQILKENEVDPRIRGTV